MGDIAVVIPVFNGAAFIEQTLDSVFAQSRQPAKVIVVDDGSTDGSIEILRQYKNIELLSNPSNGSNSARAHALEAVDTQFVVFLDHDDVWHPRHLELAGTLLEAHPNCAGVHSNVVEFRHGRTPRFRIVEPATEPVECDVWATFPFAGPLTTPSSVVIDTAHLRECGGWPIWSRAPTDAYMWFLLGIERPFIRSPHFTVAYRVRAGSLSSDLRIQRARRMSDDHLWLLGNVLGRYEEQRGDDPRLAMLTDRLDAFGQLMRLVGMIDGSEAFDALPAVAERLQLAVERDIAGDLRRDLPKFFAYRLNALLMTSSEARRSFMTVYGRWPQTALRTRDLWLAQMAPHALRPAAALAAVRERPAVLAPSALPLTIARATRTKSAYFRRRLGRMLSGQTARALRSPALRRRG